MKRKDIIKIKEITNINEAFNLCDYIAKRNKRKFNFSKLAEELNELSDVCLKFINKKGEFRPNKEKFIEELGDVITRIEMLIEAENIIKKDVDQRIIFKANKYLQYIKEGKYDKGI